MKTKQHIGMCTVAMDLCMLSIYVFYVFSHQSPVSDQRSLG